eukprot:scaffold31190_cov16-Tisochrysis_lutea.AAC.1
MPCSLEGDLARAKTPTNSAARCPLCGEMDSFNHVALRCPNPTMSIMHTNRHHIGLGFCVKTLSKGRYGMSLQGISN